jgi:hypothetical protein
MRERDDALKKVKESKKLLRTRNDSPLNLNGLFH